MHKKFFLRYCKNQNFTGIVLVHKGSQCRKKASYNLPVKSIPDYGKTTYSIFMQNIKNVASMGLKRIIKPI